MIFLKNKWLVNDANQTIQIVLVAASTALFFFLLEGHKGFSLWDEGFMWYGAQRVMVGEVPIRDFMAYDPGRYYWSAFTMLLYGDNGIMALRATEAVIQAIGLYIGLRLLVRGSAKSNIIYLFLTSFTMALWMSERHRIFESTIPIALIGILAHLVEQPSSRRYFFAGSIVGLAALFGRNHGVYGVFGSFAVFGYIAIRCEQKPPIAKALVIWGSGVVVGYLPLLLMLVFVPGFAIAFWESIRFLFEIKTTNYPLPIPWPWQMTLYQGRPENILSNVISGIFFIAIAAFCFLGIVWVIWQRWQNKTVNPVLVACVAMSLPYAHYAYSRADVYHLEDGIFSLVIACFLLLENRSVWFKWSLACLLCGASLLVMLPYHPGWKCFALVQCIKVNVAGDTLFVDQDTANDLETLQKLTGDFAPGGRSFIAVPFWPGAYALLERKSPMWEIYPIFSRAQAFEQAEIERIKLANPGFAIIFDLGLDNREDLRFRNTHPLLQQYILDNFEPVDGYSKNPVYHIYKSR